MPPLPIGRRPLASALALFTPLSAASAEPPEPSVQLAALDLLVVTATATLQPRSHSLAPVTLITREDIERANAKTLPELLRGTPGVDLSVSGGYGKATSLFLRGTGSGNALVLIDGLRIGSATTGSPSLQYLPLEQIARIEILRGPRAALYGADALGGVIQIFTIQGEDGFHPSASAGLGSHDTRRLDASLAGGGANAWGETHYSLGLAHFDTAGIDALREVSPDGDGYRNDSLLASLRHRFQSGLTADLRLLHAEGNNEYDSAFSPGVDLENDFVQQALSARLSQQLNDRWKTSLLLGRTRDESDNFADGVPGGTFDTERLHTTWQNDVRLAPGHLLTLGLDWYRDEVTSTTQYALTQRDNAALFAQWQGRRGALNWVLAGRYDDNEQFGDQSTGQLDLGYRINSGLRLTAGIGSAFKAPSFNDLYFPNFGNPNLDPESSVSVEIGADGRLELAGHAAVWRLSAYQTRVDDLINTVFSGGAFSAENVAEAEIEGIEATLATELAGWRIEAAASVLDPRDEGSGQRLRRRSPRSLKLDLDRELGPWDLGLTWLVKDGRFEDAANTEYLGGYGLLDLRLGYRIARDWHLGLELDNALDKRYATAGGFNSLDRTWLLSLRWQPR